MTKSSKTLIVIIVIVLVIVGIVWYGRSSSNSSIYSTYPTGTTATGSSTPPAPVSETTKVSGQTSEYQNAELGFSVKYPTDWEKEETETGVTFIMPIDKSQVSTVAKLQVDVDVTAGTCAFPPVTTVKDRGTLAVGADTLDMISIANNVQGRDYFNRMYSLQHGAVCYLFDLSYISLSTSSLTGSNLTQAQNNNKAIMSTADAAFTDMVKTFQFVVGPQGVDETKASPAK